MKHWPAELLEDVKDVVHLCVSSVFYSFLCTADTNLKFIKRFEELSKKTQTRAIHDHKTRTSSKPGCQNVYDTDTETDDDDSEQVVNVGSRWIEEWKLYFSTHEVVPDGVGIACWWGVHTIFKFPESTMLTVHLLVARRLLSNMAVTCP